MKISPSHKLLISFSLVILAFWVFTFQINDLFDVFYAKGEHFVNKQTSALLALGLLLIIYESLGRSISRMGQFKFSLPVLTLFFCSLFGFLFWQRATLLWTQQVTQYSAMNGYIPWSDASSYLFGGKYLAENGLPLNEWSCRQELYLNVDV